MKATHTGAAFGIEAAGMPVAFEGMLMFRMREGKCAEARNCFDFFKMFQQIGVVTVKVG